MENNDIHYKLLMHNFCTTVKNCDSELFFFQKCNIPYRFCVNKVMANNDNHYT